MTRVPRMRARPANAADREQAMALLPPWLDLPPAVRDALPDIWAAIDGAPVRHQAMEDLARRPGERLQAWGVTIGLQPSTVKALQLDGAPAPHVSRTVYQQLHDGRLSPMSDREIGECNARGELTLLNLQFSMRHVDLGSDYTLNLLTAANEVFRFGHAGFNLAAMYFEGGELDAPYVTAAGFRPRDYAAGHRLDTLPPERRPRFFGLTRAEARTGLPGTTVRHIFDHVPPRFTLSASQRRMLACALQVDSDDALALQLDVSAHGLKKLWRGIYERIEDVDPGFFGDDGVAATGDTGRRGPEKRRQVLAYARQRPEELRPWFPA